MSLLLDTAGGGATLPGVTRIRAPKMKVLPMTCVAPVMTLMVAWGATLRWHSRGGLPVATGAVR